MSRRAVLLAAILTATCLATGAAMGQGATYGVNLQKAVLNEPPPGPPLRDSIGVDVAGAGDSVTCRIEPYCSHVWIGERPRFRVRITNRSHRTVLLVVPVRGGVWREFPRWGLGYDGPPGGALASDHLSIFRDSLRADQFLPLAPGKQLDLFGGAGYSEAHVSFMRPGKYVARFSYSTAEDDLRHWLGSFQPDSLDAAWRARFRRVPRVDLHAECAFEVQQR